jgi:transaldolase
VAQARLYTYEFQMIGILKDRICIKIPSTGPALCASPILLDEGIRTLGTTIFSVVQAIAASQAGTLSISPYYNREYIKLSSAELVYI